MQAPFRRVGIKLRTPCILSQSSPPSRHRPDRPAGYESRMGFGLAHIDLSMAHVGCPFDQMADQRAAVPADVGNGGLAPVEVRAVVGADQGNVAGRSKPPLRQELEGGEEKRRFLDD